jgi:dihydrofolate synthase/folylpolyglutamate synthase
MRPTDAILERLKHLHPKVIDLALDRVLDLLHALDDPQLSLPPVIHIAGTNGKGSTLAYLRAMAEAQGRTAHAYISPHLVRFAERITVASREIDETALSALLEECERRNEGRPITFFEITTAVAFLAFARSKADLCLLETGLGGRYDATNVLDRPAASLIASISATPLRKSLARRPASSSRACRCCRSSRCRKQWR